MGNIDTILEFNKQFVASKGYEAHLTDKYPDKKLAVLSCMDTWLDGFHDTEASVRKTVATIVNHPLIPSGITVRGFIIDSATGLLTEIL